MDNKIIVESLKKYYEKIEKDKNSRYKSWEHCYKSFYDAHNLNNIDNSLIDSK